MGVFVVAAIMLILPLAYFGVGTFLVMVVFAGIFAAVSTCVHFRGAMYALVTATLALDATYLIAVGIIDYGNRQTGGLLIYAAALCAAFVYLAKLGEKDKKDAEEPLKTLQQFAEDYSHFLTGYHHCADVYWNSKEKGIYIQTWVIDPDTRQKEYRDADRLEPSFRDAYLQSSFFGNYTPSPLGAHRCYQLMDKGTHELAEYSLWFQWPLYTGGGYSVSILRILAEQMEQKYKKAFKKGSSNSFTLSFD